jgi:hypothetical protein
MDDLSQFTGTENWYRHSKLLIYTDGIKYVAEEGKAYWLIDAIASYQSQLRKNRRLAELQLWELKVTNNKAILTCKEDSNCPPIVTQEIEYTDFPLPYIKLYVENEILLLPSEH